jgi:serine/threonine protein kinase
MKENRCPPPEQIKAYLAGLLEQDGYDSLSEHLLGCQDCEQTVIALEAEPDTLVEILKQPHTPDSSELDEAMPIVNSGPAPASEPPTSSLRNGIPKQLGQYELISLLGSGGMGAVYLARHQSLDKKVALKLLPALPSQNAEFVARFQREMRAAGKLDAPAIVRTTDAGQQDGIHYLVMDVIDGLNLSHIARAERKLTIADACELIKQTAMGLAHAHEKGIVHRDVKPSNLMLDCNGQVRILDFGLAQISFWDSGSAEITTVGQLMGTLDYMAPEQAERGGAVDYRADLYSLGATLFRLLTGRAPLAAAPNLTPLEKLRLLGSHKPPRLRSLRPDAPSGLGDIVDSMLSRDPALRPASAIHAAELLEPYTNDADLIGLLQRAKSNPIRDESDMNWNPLWQRGLIDELSIAPKLSPSRSRFGGWGKWIAAACLGGMALGGILFVIETSKGQLVIDSEANVQVRLVSIDESGNKTDIDDLKIMPGTKATRLRSGKYEIVLEGASDSFVVHNGSFSIRNGEVIVATVTKKDSANEATSPTVDTVKETSSDPRLTGIVYEGKSLREWLEIIRYERSVSELEKAITALSQIAEPSVDDLISVPITDLIRRKPSFFRLSAYILYQCNPDRYIERLADFLDRNPVVVNSSDTLHSLSSVMYFSTSGAKQPFERLYPYLERSIQSAGLDQRLDVAFPLRSLACVSGQSSIPKEFQEKVVEILGRCKELNNESFWFRTTSPLGGNAESFGEVLASETVRRVLASLSDAETSKEEIALALLMMRKLIEDGYMLSQEETAKLVESIGPLLQIPTSTLPVVDVFSFPEDCFLPKWSTGFLSSSSAFVKTKANGHKQRNVRVENTILAIDFIDSAKLQEQMKPQLLRLLEELDATRLWGTTLFELTTRAPKYDWLAIAVDAPTEFNQLLLRQLVYGQVAATLGQDNAAIFARFATMRKPDWDHELAECAKKIRAEDSDGLNRLRAYHNSNKDLQISELLESTLIEKGSADYLKAVIGHLHISLLSHVNGNQFPASLARVAEGLDKEARLALLYRDFSRLEDFRCDDPGAMEVLLKWCDEKLRDQASIMSNPDSEAIVDFLARLVFEQKNVSVECQQLIADRLESYSGLGAENFWLKSPLVNPKLHESHFKTISYCEPMRLAVLRKAIQVLAAKEEYSGKLRCHAWIIILHSYEDTSRLAPAVRDELRKGIESKLEQWAKNPEECLVMTPVDDAFEVIANRRLAELSLLSDSPDGPFQHFFQYVFPSIVDNLGVCEIGLANSYLLRLKADELFAPSLSCQTAIQALHEKSELMGRDITHSNIWASLFKIHRASGIVTPTVKQIPSLVNQLIYVQTGTLLGMDANELADRPYKLYEQDQERLARFIQPGDTLSIFVSGLASGEPPVIQAGTRTPIAGFPVIVSQENTIFVPNLGTFETKDKDLEQLEKEIVEKAQPLQKLNAQQHVGQVNVAFLLRHNQQLELRNVTGTPAAK